MSHHGIKHYHSTNSSRCKIPEKLYVFRGKRERFVAYIPVVLVSSIYAAQWNVLELTYKQNRPPHTIT